MMHMMVDLETLDTAVSTKILSIGAVLFDPRGEGYAQMTFYRNLSVETQRDRTESQATMDWWAQQNEAAKAKLQEGPHVPIAVALKDLRDYFQGAKYPWSHGASFDLAILDHAYQQQGLWAPWKFWDARDTRTLFSLAGDYRMPKGDGVAHDALDDAKRQAKAVQTCYQRLNLC